MGYACLEAACSTFGTGSVARDSRSYSYTWMGTLIHGSLHILVDPVTRRQGRKIHELGGKGAGRFHGWGRSSIDGGTNMHRKSEELMTRALN